MGSPRFHLSSLCTWELNFGQTIWDKTQVLLGTSWEMHVGTFWELGNPLGTYENKGKKKNPCPLSPLKKKNWTIHECMLSHPIGCMKFLFPKLRRLMAGAEFWGHSNIA